MKKICVFCGSRDGRVNGYLDLARRTGTEIAGRGWGLVYGGGGKGMMGELSGAALEAGGHVTGVIPEFMTELEHVRKDVSDLRVTKSMSQRKELMLELADAFLILPGGIGTLDELFEFWTCEILLAPAKPIIILNEDGFYGRLITFLDHVVSEGFLDWHNREKVQIAESFQHAFDMLEKHFSLGRADML